MCMWNLNKQTEQTKQKWTHRKREQTGGCGGVGGERSEEW